MDFVGGSAQVYYKLNDLFSAKPLAKNSIFLNEFPIHISTNVN
jgi:hypothetical protein